MDTTHPLNERKAARGPITSVADQDDAFGGGTKLKTAERTLARAAECASQESSVRMPAHRIKPTGF